MGRNSLAGSTKGQSKSAKYFRDNPEARKKKDAYNTLYHSTVARKKYRADLGKLNSKMGKKGDGLDVAHTSKTKAKLQSASKNRSNKKTFIFGKRASKK
jgi:hypothetical protein